MNKDFYPYSLHEQAFLDSALTYEGVTSNKMFFEWFDSRRNTNLYEVQKVSLNDLDGWYFGQGTGNLVHKSGKFFQIEGIDVRTNFGLTPWWMQPIINQPEIGILGILTKKINAILHFLMQAKMEPGNINILQLCPTVQATRSNYTQVHGGKKVPYLEYFLDRTKARIIVDQLQSEQGSRFLRKRNRNMIVEVYEDEAVEEHEDFCWLTLGQIFSLLKLDNIVNMDSRTVVSCIRFACPQTVLNSISLLTESKEFSKKVYISSLAEDKLAINRFDEIISWITDMKTRYKLDVRCVPLCEVDGWFFDGTQIKHKTGRFFWIVGVTVKASNREIPSWDQPLIESAKGGILCFVCQKKKGILHFLVQGRVEPGNLDYLEMAPTLQCTPSNYDPDRPELRPPFYDLVMTASPSQIRYSALQSEEGGRFYHDQNRYLVIEVDESEELNLPSNYIWMTIRQIKEFIRFNNYFNIESRGLLSCMGLSFPGLY